jgi:hypothetical protein
LKLTTIDIFLGGELLEAELAEAAAWDLRARLQLSTSSSQQATSSIASSTATMKATLLALAALAATAQAFKDTSPFLIVSSSPYAPFPFPYPLPNPYHYFPSS